MRDSGAYLRLRLLEFVDGDRAALREAGAVHLDSVRDGRAGHEQSGQLVGIAVGELGCSRGEADADVGAIGGDRHGGQ